jgi:hypothetical protein
MAYLQLESNNPNFSYVISKNPASGMVVKTIRQGFGFGWFTERIITRTNSYNLYFTDKPEINSFSHESFSYLDTTGLCSPYAYLNLLDNFFRTAIQEQQEEDTKDTYKHTLFINFLTIENKKYFDIFSRFFTDYKFEYLEVTKERFSVKISTSKSIHELLNLTCVFLLFASLFDKDTYVRTEDDLLIKYLGSLKTIQIPYFIAYLFKINFLKEREKLEKHYFDLVEATREMVIFEFGNTLQQRKNWVKDRFNIPVLSDLGNFDLIDFGAGEEFNYRFLANLDAVQSYIPIDSDPEVRKEIDNKTEYKKLQKVQPCLEKISDIKNWNNQTVILATEVFEHIPFSLVETSFASMCMFSEVQNIIVTLPNFEFNQFYSSLDADFRHDDHKWEPSGFDCPYITTLIDIADSLGFNCITQRVGDVVNGIPCTLGLHFYRS